MRELRLGRWMQHHDFHGTRRAAGELLRGASDRRVVDLHVAERETRSGPLERVRLGGRVGQRLLAEDREAGVRRDRADRSVRARAEDEKRIDAARLDELLDPLVPVRGRNTAALADGVTYRRRRIADRRRAEEVLSAKNHRHVNRLRGYTRTHDPHANTIAQMPERYPGPA